jgi:dihydroorotase
MHYDLIIKNGNIVTPKETFTGDVFINSGKIVKAGSIDTSDTADDIYDASGKHVLPGIIDAHVHFRDPGLTNKEDFETGSLAAAMGGITMIADMPNVIPVTSTALLLNEKIKIAKEKSYVDFAFYALLTNDNLNEIECLKNAGALGYKVFFGTSTGDVASPSLEVLAQQMDKCASLGMRIGFHAESNEINQNFTSVAKAETDSPDGFWLDYARPVMSEIYAMKTIVSLALESKIKIHFHHVTSEDGALIAEEAKEKGVNLTAETCPHYLLFDCQQDVHKVYPPIRDESHQNGLWDAIGKGIIDMLASDHAPHTVSEKAQPLWEAPAGLTGVETSVCLLLNEVNKGKITINDYVRLASENPAKIWDIYPQKGSLQTGADADITIVDMNKKKVIRAGELHSKSKTSPYDGMEVQGIPVATIVRGAFIMKDGVLTGTKGYGVLVNPKNN